MKRGLAASNDRAPRRALVTGGAGFLGSHLVARLLRDGWRVVVLDDLSRGSRATVERHAADPQFSFFAGSIVAPGDVRAAVAWAQPDVVFHLAALHFIPYCSAHPDETVVVNVVGTQCVLDALDGAARAPHTFVLASTADVYAVGDAPHHEDHRQGSSNVYGASKIACEHLLALARRNSRGTRFLSARFFNIFGPGETNPHVLPDIIDGVAGGGTLRLGNLDARRDYVHVSDVAEALLRLADYEGTHLAFNVGSGHGTSVAELVWRLERILGYALPVEVDPAKLRPVERQHLVAEISRIRTAVGWAPRMALDEGLADLVRQAGIVGGAQQVSL